MVASVESYIIEDLQGYPQLELGLTSQKLTRLCRINWDDIENLSIALFSNIQLIGGQPQYVGATHPKFTWLRASSCSIVPQNDDPAAPDSSGGARYAGGALCSITYERPQYDQSQQQSTTVYTERASIGGEFLSIPNNGLTWETGGKTPTGDGVQAGVFIPIIERQISFPQITTFPLNTIRAYVGCVNSTTFRGASAETVLFLGAEINYSFNSNGDILYSLDYRFSEKRIIDGTSTVGWNHFMDPDNSNRWDRLKRGSKFIYEKKDLNNLLTQIS